MTSKTLKLQKGAILPLVTYGYETRSLTLKEEYKLQVFKKV
jgi:hypothetical protein